MKLYQYSLDGTFISEFENSKDAKRRLNINYDPIRSFRLGCPDKNGW